MPAKKLLAIFVAGTFVMRAAGCVINDLADRKFDCHVARTQNRPLTNGEISMTEALITVTILLAGALVLLLQLNWRTVQLAPLALALTLLYPFCKRVTYWPQLVLGITFNMGIIMAFTASNANLYPNGWLLYGIAFVWTLAFDTIYAIADRPYDATIGIKSSALRLGSYDRLFIISLQLIIILGLLALGVINHCNWPFYAAIIIVAMMFGYQYHHFRDYDQAACMQAFINNHWAWLTVLLGIMASLS
jgi:4-hydroxybenzoate polyprenyltransferase